MAFMEAFQEQVRLAGANLGGIYQLICDLTVLDTLASAYNEVRFKKLPGKARFPHVEVCSHLTSFSPNGPFLKCEHLHKSQYNPKKRPVFYGMGYHHSVHFYPVTIDTMLKKRTKKR